MIPPEHPTPPAPEPLAAGGAPAEQAFRLDPWGRGPRPGPYPLRPEVVDFAFAPPHGWGALSLILLGREGDVYTMCPFAPWGARFPRVTLENLVPPDTASELWLSGTFPSLRFAAADGRGMVGGGGGGSERRGGWRRGGRGGSGGRGRLSLDEDDDDGVVDVDEDRGVYWDDDGGEDADEYGGDDDDGRGGGLFGGHGGGGGDSSEAWAGPTVAARPMRLEGTVTAMRGPLPLGTDPIEDGGGGGACGGGGMLGRGVVARVLAAAPFAAGEGGGALLAVAHQRVSSAPRSSLDTPDEAVGLVCATLDILILPQEPSPGWAAVHPDDEAAAAEAAAFGGGPPMALTPLVTDDDEGALPPLLAIDRVELASGESTLRRPRSLASAAANELAPFVSVAWDPGCRERVFCCAGGAVHGITLNWLSAVEGAADEEEGGGAGGSAEELSLPTVVTLLDSQEVLLGVAPIGDPLAEGLLVAVDAGGMVHGLYPTPPLPGGMGDDEHPGGAEGAENAATAAAAAAAAEASAELRALAGGPVGARPTPPAGAAALTPGTTEGNAALAAAAAGLKERHLRFAHRVHAAARRHSLRMGAAVRQQRAEASALRAGVVLVVERRESLAVKLACTRAAHEDIRGRLRALAEAERLLPHPLTRAESAFKITLQASADDVPLLRAKLEELKRRTEECGEVGVEAMGVFSRGTSGGGGSNDNGKGQGGLVGSLEGLRLSVPALMSSDPAVHAELVAQEAAIKANRDRVRLIELTLGAL